MNCCVVRETMNWSGILRSRAPVSQLVQLALKTRVNSCVVSSEALVREFSQGPNLSNEPHEIYYGDLTPKILGVKIFSLTTSAGGLAAQPILYEQMSATSSMPLIIGVASFLGFFTFATPLLLHALTKKYVTHIMYDAKQEEYIACVLSFFLRKKKIPFKVADVEIPNIPGMFTSFTIKGRPVFVDPAMFKEPQHYAKFMRYDKPIDFKLGKISEKINESEKKMNERKHV